MPNIGLSHHSSMNLSRRTNLGPIEKPLCEGTVKTGLAGWCNHLLAPTLLVPCDCLRIGTYLPTTDTTSVWVQYMCEEAEGPLGRRMPAAQVGKLILP